MPSKRHHQSLENRETHLGYLTQNISHLLRTEVHGRLERLGLTRAQMNLLANLFDMQGCTQKSLAARLEIEPAPVGRMIDDLEDAGWVERRPSPTDRRAWQLFIPQQIAKSVFEIETHLVDIYDAALAGLTDKQITTMLHAMQQVQKNLTGFVGHHPPIDPDKISLPPKVRKAMQKSQAKKSSSTKPLKKAAPANA